MRNRWRHWRARHHWWHRTHSNGWDGKVYLWCSHPLCGIKLAEKVDDGYRCSVCGSAFCDEMEHH